MKKEYKKEITNFIALVLGAFIVAFTFNLFAVPNNYVTGGLSGITIIFNHLFKMSVSTTLLVGNIFLIIVGVLVLGVKDTTPSIIGSLIYTAFVYLTENINNYLNIQISSVFINIVIIGILTGIGSAMVYIAGYSTGGVDILGIIFRKKMKVPLGEALLLINAIIILLGAIVFGIEMLVISLIIRFISSRVIDSILMGKSDSKVMFIKTNKKKEIKDYIIKEIKSGASEIKVTSGYKNAEDEIIMCVVPTETYIKLKDKILKTDKEAFITILDAYEVYGGTNRYRLPLHDMRV